jgi:hypothetical protein
METGMFSTELTYRRRRNPRRTLYGCLAVAAVAALSAGLAYALPVFEVNDRWLQRASWRHVALWAGSTLSLLAALAAAIVHFWRTATRSHDSLQSIRWLSRASFNRLVEEGFRGQGYVVQSSERFFSRAGIDLILRKAENHILVLCRRDPEPARQLAAVAGAACGDGNATMGAAGLLITCERVAPEVKAYAAEQGIAVIEGPALLKLVERARGYQPTPARRREPHFAIPLTDLPVCSECGGPWCPARITMHDPEMRAWHCSRGPACHTPRLA